MAEQVVIYNNVAGVTKTLDVEVLHEIVSGEDQPPNGSVEFYIKITPRGRILDTDGNAVKAKVARSLNDLALTGIDYSQKQRWQNSANAYSDINEMIADYAYDLVYGHAAGQWGVPGLPEQAPMQF